MEQKKEYMVKKNDLRKMISFTKQVKTSEIEDKFKSQDTIKK